MSEMGRSRMRRRGTPVDNMCICKHSPGESGQLECGQDGQNGAACCMWNAHGVTGAYVGAILFFVTLGNNRQFRSRARRGDVLDERKPIDLFIIHWRESFSLAGGSFPSVSSSESTLVQNCHNGPKSSRDQGHPPRGRTRAAHSSILRSGLWA